MEVQPILQNLMISANCNTVFDAISYNKKHKLLAYAAANCVIIMDPFYKLDKVPKVLFTLKGHTDRVNAVSWINDRILVSISSDKSIIIWSCASDVQDLRDPKSWTFKKVIAEAHQATINYLQTYTIQNADGSQELYIATMCSSGSLKFWQGKSEDDIQFRGELLFGKNLQEVVGITQIGEKHLLVAVGGYDMNIHVYLVPRIQFQVESDKKLFKYKFSLLGHFNSIRDFAFTDLMAKDIRYFASSSQDNNIRLWKIQPLENISDGLGGHTDANTLRQFESKTSFVLQDDEESKVYNITLESVLTNHQESVSSVFWGKLNENNESLEDYCLLSASFDFTVCVWKSDAQSGIWSIDSTLGAMTGNKHAYFGAIFLEDDMKILAYTYNGALHQWRKKVESDIHQWIPQLTVKGHFGEVSDFDWDQHDVWLISTSQDQTTRIFAEYSNDLGWFEFGRPQVHGYDMNTCAAVKVYSQSQKLPSKILSGGDEKVLRLFESSYSIIKTFNALTPTDIKLRYQEQRTNEEVEKLITSEAKKQPLGLMNKPVSLANEKMRVDEEEMGGIGSEFDPIKFLSNTKDKLVELIEELEEPPVEDVLMVKTLWPEQQKLYGHAFEIFCIAVTQQGDCAASACKAKEKKYADIIIWDLSKSQSTVPTCRLAAHTLTVIQLEFSKCGTYLLSCSRDRSWALFKRDSSEILNFTLVKKMKDAHSRILWGVSWSHNDAFFATASREKLKSVKVWHGLQEGQELGSLHSEPPEENPSATAISFFPSFTKGNQYSLIVGLESGDMFIWSLQSNKQWVKQFAFPDWYSHCSTVRRIKFNKRMSVPEKDEYVVASCGNDHTVRVFKVLLQ